MPVSKVLVVDDSSPDGTGDLADRLAAEDSHVRVLHRPLKEGLGQAYIAGFREALAVRREYQSGPEHAENLAQFAVIGRYQRIRRRDRRDRRRRREQFILVGDVPVERPAAGHQARGIDRSRRRVRHGDLRQKRLQKIGLPRLYGARAGAAEGAQQGMGGVGVLRRRHQSALKDGRGLCEAVGAGQLDRTLHVQAGDVGPEVARIKAKTELPVIVGFGINTPEAARTIASVADGCVVGSAIVSRRD